MLACVFDGSRLHLSEHETPRARPGHAVVAVRCAGICNTDLELVRGYMGFSGVLGHELVGTVVEGPAEWLGQRVTSEINFACGVCRVCQRGLGRHCPTRTVMGILGADGALAEAVLVPVANLHAIPDGVSDEAAVFAEPLAAAFEILEQVHVVPGERALVLGDGKLGLLVAMVLHGAGLDVTAVGKHDDKLAHLARLGIATQRADAPLAGDADLVVEATGTAAGLARAIALTRPRGTLVLKSTVADKSELHLAPVVIHELTVVGSRCGSFAPALRALGARSIPVEPLISARFPLREALRAFDFAAQRGVLKVLVTNEAVTGTEVSGHNARP